VNNTARRYNRRHDRHPSPARARNIRIVPHPESIEVRFPDGRCRYFYFDDEDPIRRQLMGRTTRAEAAAKAQAFARQMQPEVDAVFVCPTAVITPAPGG
jgi:hypothetical protein